MEKQDQTKRIQSLEEDLEETREKLTQAENQIENGKAEMYNLQTVSNGLKAQCNKLTNELQDSDFKSKYSPYIHRNNNG